MTGKVMSLQEAASLVQPGHLLALGGMTLYRRPVAFVRKLIRQGTGELTLLAPTAGYESDLLVGAGLVKRVLTCYFPGHPPRRSRHPRPRRRPLRQRHAGQQLGR